MPDTKISLLTDAGALTGSEIVPLANGGANERTTTQAIADLAPGGSGWTDVPMDGSTSTIFTSTTAVLSTGTFAISDADAYEIVAIIKRPTTGTTIGLHVVDQTSGEGLGISYQNDGNVVLYRTAAAGTTTVLRAAGGGMLPSQVSAVIARLFVSFSTYNIVKGEAFFPITNNANNFVGRNIKIAALAPNVADVLDVKYQQHN